jgi:hypothetical protein
MLEVLVGGSDALMQLDAEPLPNDEFDWSSVEPQDQAFVTLVLALVDRALGVVRRHGLFRPRPKPADRG